jgi:hypothetical protein
MPKFMLLLHESPRDFTAWTPERMQEVIQRYRAWGEGLMQSGQYVGGSKLKEEGGRHLRSQGGRAEVTDGPYSEAKEVLGGYFTVEAADYDAAVEIARACPHLENGWIEVREIDPT